MSWQLPNSVSYGIVLTAMQPSSTIPEAQRPVDRDQITAAERLIRSYVRRTPIVTTQPDHPPLFRLSRRT